MEASNKSPYRLKNAVSVEMPDYIIRSPNTLLRNDKGELALSKDVNIKAEQPFKKPLVTINKNQKFGYHKDTPFYVGDSKTNQAAMEFNRNTKAILSLERNGQVKP